MAPKNEAALKIALQTAEASMRAFHLEIAKDPAKKAKQIAMYKRQMLVFKDHLSDKKYWIKFLEENS